MRIKFETLTGVFMFHKSRKSTIQYNIVGRYNPISGEIPCIHSVSERESKWLSGLDLAMPDDTL